MWSTIIVTRKGICKPITTRSKEKKAKWNVIIVTSSITSKHIATRRKEKTDKRNKTECHYCHRIDHVQVDCYKKKRKEGQANVVEEKDIKIMLFMAKIDEEINASQTANMAVKKNL
jgi:hypothetical protein